MSWFVFGLLFGFIFTSIYFYLRLLKEVNMSQLNPQDVTWIMARLPKEVRNIMITHNVILAGGFIRSIIAKEEVNDIDLFVNSKDRARVIIDLLNERMCNGKPRNVYDTDNAYTIRTDKGVVQVIHRWVFDTLQDCVASFDFTIAKAGIKYLGSFDGKIKWASECWPTFYEDLASKRLVYTSPVREEEAGGSMLRLLKFTKKGYHVPLASLAAVMSRMVNAIQFDKLPDPMDTQESRIAKVLTALLYEVDPDIVSLENGEHQ